MSSEVLSSIFSSDGLIRHMTNPQRGSHHLCTKGSLTARHALSVWHQRVLKSREFYRKFRERCQQMLQDREDSGNSWVPLFTHKGTQDARGHNSIVQTGTGVGTADQGGADGRPWFFN